MQMKKFIQDGSNYFETKQKMTRKIFITVVRFQRFSKRCAIKIRLINNTDIWDTKTGL